MGNKNNESQLEVKELSSEKLVAERKRVLAHCLNLECQTEHLKILIEKLNKLSIERENVLFQNKDEFLKDISNLYLKRTTMCKDIEVVNNKKQHLEKSIINLKDRISFIDKLLMR